MQEEWRHILLFANSRIVALALRFMREPRD
jgi:hypothetical protein